jgi:hypothetical protein
LAEHNSELDPAWAVTTGPEHVVELASVFPTATEGEDAANARLIAAAPDLLHAAGIAIEALRDVYPEHWTNRQAQALVLLRNAVAKTKDGAL